MYNKKRNCKPAPGKKRPGKMELNYASRAVEIKQMKSGKKRGAAKGSRAAQSSGLPPIIEEASYSSASSESEKRQKIGDNVKPIPRDDRSASCIQRFWRRPDNMRTFDICNDFMNHSATIAHVKSIR